MDFLFSLHIQVDSGYNTTSAAAFSLIDGLNTDSQSRESSNSNMAEAAFHVAQNIRVKVPVILHTHRILQLRD